MYSFDTNARNDTSLAERDTNYLGGEKTYKKYCAYLCVVKIIC